LSMKESKSQDIRKFKNILEKKWITVTTRDSLGREAKSACGQLWYEKVEKDNSAQ
jgi:adenine C2-methylase RlmN of 23S rRNA A2503 and tRNA A37